MKKTAFISILCACMFNLVSCDEKDDKADGKEQPAQQEQKADEQKPAEDGKPAADADKKDGEQGDEAKPADGEAKPADGEAKPADGEEAKPTDEQKPADGQGGADKPADGDKKESDAGKPADEKKPEEDKDYDEWLTKTYNTINDKITVLQQERRINKEDNHAQLSRKNKKLM